MLPINDRKKSYLALFIGVCFMGFAAIFIKSANAPGLVTVCYRMVIASIVIFFPFFIKFRKDKNRLARKGIKLAGLAGIFFGLDMVLWSKGVVVSDNATIPTLFANLAPVWVGFGALVIFNEKPRLNFWIGVSLALIGMGMFILNQLNAKGELWKGMLMGTLAGVLYASFYLAAQKGRKLLDTISFLFISTSSSAILLISFMAISGYSFFKYDTHTYLMFIGIGLGVQVIAWFMINYAQGYLPATLVAPSLLLQPVFTAIWAILLLKEHLNLLQLIAGLIIIIGIYLVNSRKR